MEFRVKQPIRSQSLAAAAAVMLLSTGLCSPPALAQTGACQLVPDKRSPNERIMRCGEALTVQPAPGTLYRPLDAGTNGPPGAVQVDSGAVYIEFRPAGKRPDFQVRTPQAIAAVRGTIWAVDVTPGQSSVLVLDGEVRVARTSGAGAVTLRPGQGVDVTDAGGPTTPLEVKTWPQERVRALLARFGR